MKDELNRSYNGGGVVYLLQSELSTSTRQYVFSLYHTSLKNIRLAGFQILGIYRTGYFGVVFNWGYQTCMNSRTQVFSKEEILYVHIFNKSSLQLILKL